MYPGLIRGLAIAGVMLGAAGYAAGGGAAEPRPTLESVQAICIQEGMLRGVVGERLKGYVDSCVKAKGGAPLQDVKPESTDTPAC